MYIYIPEPAESNYRIGIERIYSNVRPNVILLMGLSLIFFFVQHSQTPGLSNLETESVHTTTVFYLPQYWLIQKLQQGS